MELKDAIKTLEAQPHFQAWKAAHPNHFLAHGFLMPQEDPNWQIGYSEGQTVTTFVDEHIIEGQEVVKRPDKVIEPLAFEKLLLPLEKAQACFEEIRKEHYPAEHILKLIILVQHREQDVYNITGLTQSFKTLNVRIDMVGTVLEHSLDSLIGQGPSN